ATCSLSPSPSPFHFMSSSSLLPLLRRIASKIAEKSSRPWFELHRSHFYVEDNGSGISNPQDLSAAFQHFHVILSNEELNLLFRSYPILSSSSSSSSSALLRQVGFDFKSLANDLFPEFEGPVTYTKNKGVKLLEQQEQQQKERQS